MHSRTIDNGRVFVRLNRRTAGSHISPLTKARQPSHNAMLVCFWDSGRDGWQIRSYISKAKGLVQRESLIELQPIGVRRIFQICHARIACPGSLARIPGLKSETWG